jgi:hypothetical protein
MKKGSTLELRPKRHVKLAGLSKSDYEKAVALVEEFKPRLASVLIPERLSSPTRTGLAKCACRTFPCGNG